eukprot:TRINITY_DN3301_c0_g1_i1.p1 TRINITY_DN3301_c0_g1~~TRINITY_DN3301_c0_g1_i1.p1  ORF type:complete len:1036 (-),score=352.10 TRINITY_DN3301_c0_g1_i1:40-3147(-)
MWPLSGRMLEMEFSSNSDENTQNTRENPSVSSDNAETIPFSMELKMEEETNNNHSQCEEAMDICQESYSDSESAHLESFGWTQREENERETFDFEMENNYLMSEGSNFNQAIGLEIILQIFGYLCYVDLASCASTCRAFYVYSFHPLLPQWKNLSLFAFRRTLNQDILLGILSRCTLLKSLDLKFCKLVKSTKKLEELFKKGTFRNLERLDLSGSLLEEDELLGFTRVLLENCPNLRFIDFSWTKLKKAENIQNLLVHESKRMRENSLLRRKETLLLRFSSNLHIKSGKRMLMEMNIKIDFLEKPRESQKIKFILNPYREDDPKDLLPRLKLNTGLKARPSLAIWKVALFVCNRLNLNSSSASDEVFPEDFIQLYYNETPLYNIYSMSLSSILDSPMHPSESTDIYLTYRKIKQNSSKSIRKHTVQEPFLDGKCREYCSSCLLPLEHFVDIEKHNRDCNAVFCCKALLMDDLIHSFSQEFDIASSMRNNSMNGLDFMDFPSGLVSFPVISKKRSNPSPTSSCSSFDSSFLPKNSKENSVEDSLMNRLQEDFKILSFHGESILKSHVSDSEDFKKERGIGSGIVNCISVSKDSRWILCGFKSGGITVFSGFSMDNAQWKIPPNFHGEEVVYVSWFPESSNQFVASFKDGTVYTFDTLLPPPEKLSKSMAQETNKKHSMTIIHNKKELNPKSVWWYNGGNFSWNRNLIASKLSSKFLLANLNETSLTIYDLKREMLVHQEQIVHSHVSSIEWTHDGRFLVVGGGGALFLWSLSQKSVVHIKLLLKESSTITSIHQDMCKSTGDEYHMACVTSDGFLCSFKIVPERDSNSNCYIPKIFVKNTSDLGMNLSSICFGQNFIAVSTFGGRVRVWNRKSQKEQSTLSKGVDSLKTLVLRFISDRVEQFNFKVDVPQAKQALEILKEVAPQILLQIEFNKDSDKYKKTTKCARCSNSFGVVFKHKHRCKCCNASVCNSCIKAVAAFSPNLFCTNCHPLVAQAATLSFNHVNNMGIDLSSLANRELQMGPIGPVPGKSPRSRRR